MSKKVFAIIPARMASTRFPNKPLVKILGLPMIEHVRRRALLAKGVDDVIVATCDQVIIGAVHSYGGKAILTSDQHERASERAAEAMTHFSADVVAVVQGDEPTLSPTDVEMVIAPLIERDDLECVSLLSPLNEPDFHNPNIVKAACDQHGRIMYFSRAPIPYLQKNGIACPIYRETGIRAFRADFLQTYWRLPTTPFERTEAVDMMRVLENGYRILGVPVAYTTMGVDHPEDVPLVEQAIQADPIQRELYEHTLKLGAA